jgi:hypothetical protein
MKANHEYVMVAMTPGTFILNVPNVRRWRVFVGTGGQLRGREAVEDPAGSSAGLVEPERRSVGTGPAEGSRRDVGATDS